MLAAFITADPARAKMIADGAWWKIMHLTFEDTSSSVFNLLWLFSNFLVHENFLLVRVFYVLRSRYSICSKRRRDGPANREFPKHLISRSEFLLLLKYIMVCDLNCF